MGSTGVPAQHSVLFAMHDATVALAFARILDERCHSAYVVGSVIEALESEPSDVLVTDLGEITGASINGLDLLEDLHASGIFPRAILIAHEGATADDYRRALRLGAMDILERPLLPETLVATVEVPRAAEGAQGLPYSDRNAEAAYVNRYGDDAPLGMRIELVAADGAAEAAARDLIGWCARCEITPSTRARIGTAVAEAVANGVVHGARNIVVCADLDATNMTVHVEDDGPGFDSLGVLTEGRLDSSSGLGRIHSLAEHVSVDSIPGSGTTLHLGFHISSADFEDEDRIDLSELDYFSPDTSRELLATLSEEPDAPVILSPALAVVVGRLLMGPDPSQVLSEALWS